MKNKIIFLLTIFFGMMHLSTTGFGKEVPADAPAVVIPSRSFDFGTVFEGTEVVHAYIIQNSGTGTLEIKKVQPG